ncbi:hypothetical protein AU099_gp66 [Gordonia phage GTE8]|uniref:Uncharacterized protein n=1 Tax=Gordonia phage GTE8 TaxID=1647475 RepID=A0A0K0N662_9CAUD|nr:hypothetical protein AU099_gp66 [Gordonia phage GTE8]AKJ72409.1 hypothetical protein GTE8_66 [Gordonia phage GTE8]
MEAVYRGMTLTGTPAEIAEFLSKCSPGASVDPAPPEPQQEIPSRRRHASKRRRRPFALGITDDHGRELQALTDGQFSTYSIVESSDREEMTTKQAARAMGVTESVAYGRLAALAKIGVLNKHLSLSGATWRIAPHAIGEPVRYIPDSEVPEQDPDWSND